MRTKVILKTQLVISVFLLALPGSVMADYCRWTDRGLDHLWSNPQNWHYGYIPTAQDTFLSTPYYAQRPDWSLYRILIEDGITAVCSNAKNMNQLEMDITGGSFTVINEWKIGQDDGKGVVINMSGGTVNVGTYVDLCGWSENSSMGTLSMSGGTFIITGALRMGMWTTSHSYLNLESGTVEAGDLAIGVGEVGIDITEGMLIVAGNHTTNIEFYVDQGVITAYGGAGSVLYDYGMTFPYKTTVTAVPPRLVGLEITGPNDMLENSSSIYKAIAYYENGGTKDITDLALWAVEPNTVASIEAGVLTTKDIAEGQLATIQASYTQGDVTIESQKAIHIFALLGIEISGPDEVAENFRAGYKAMVYYEDSSTKNVTDLAFWAVEPNTVASIEAGMLTAKDIVKDQPATILAGYTDGDTTFEVEKAIDILSICPTGAALSFDGVDDYVEVDDDASLNFTTVYTDAWIKTSSNGIGTVVNKRDEKIRVDWRGFVLFVEDGYVRFGADDGPNLSYTPISGTKIDDGRWHYIGGKFDGESVTTYVDGFENTKVDASLVTGNLNNDDELRIGAQWDGSSKYVHCFDGAIDEARIWNRALSAEEIWANTHMRLTGNEPNLVAYWDFDEGNGQIVYDLSGNGNDGRLGSTQDVDDNDPVWVKSDAPIGRCTPYLIATGAMKEALKHKRASIQDVESSLTKEWTAYEALEQWLEGGGYGDVNKGDIVTAKQKIHSATQHEEQSMDALEKGIENLEDALSELDYAFIPPNVSITYPLDGAQLSCYQMIEIEAYAWDIDGTVVKVEFFADESKIGEDNDGADGWTTIWSEHKAGNYSLTTRATDDDEMSTTSPAVTITLTETPGQATNPSPADGATGVSRNSDLIWTAGTNAVSHNVYFGTISPGTFRGNLTIATFDPGTMAYNTTYYWRIDEINPNGTTTGIVWTFTTSGGPQPPPPPPPPSW